MGKVKDLQHIAIDPLDQVFTWPAFQYLLAEKAAKMKQLLMDQKFISGLGNIYSDEVLFGAGLRYDRMSNTLSSQEVRRLYRAIQEVLQEAIKMRGTTLDDDAYLDLFGEPGAYQNELKVYGRAGLPCRRCRTPIEVVKISQRSSFFCPQCQSGHGGASSSQDRFTVCSSGRRAAPRRSDSGCAGGSATSPTEPWRRCSRASRPRWMP
jgi:formamidopyrimidine-DNA glycosylase